MACNFLDYSLFTQPGEKLLLEVEPGCEELSWGPKTGVYAWGAQPLFELVDPSLCGAQLLGAVREQMDLEWGWRPARVKEMGVRRA